MYKKSKVKFHQKNNQIKEQSSKMVVDILFELFNPKSVVDVGCGTGLILKYFNEKDVDILGYEGEWINKNLIESNISFSKLKIIDFENIDLENLVQFDLCVCLEVAEHISENQADNFVKFLISQSKIIVFSAAIPNQGGFNHINEQWSDYWDKKFDTLGYSKMDILRPILWDFDFVTWPYKQNMVVYVHKTDVSLLDKLDKMPINALKNPIHFESYINKTNKYLRVINYKESTFFYFKLLIKKIINNFKTR